MAAPSPAGVSDRSARREDPRVYRLAGDRKTRADGGGADRVVAVNAHTRALRACCIYMEA